MIKLKTLFLIPVLFFSNQVMSECILKMGYTTESRKPMIQKSPDNSGVYYDLYTLAATKIGCKLIIERNSKKRILQKLKYGFIDFYSEALFTTQRSKYSYFIDNGLVTREYEITPLRFSEITSYTDVQSLELVWLLERGSSKKEIVQKLRIQTHQVNYVDIEKVLLLFETRGVNFYVANKAMVDSFTYNRPSYFLEYNGIKLHNRCCGSMRPMLLAFSKKSKHYFSQSNLLYKKSNSPSFTNQSEVPLAGSVVYKFKEALEDLKREGKPQYLYEKHLKYNWKDSLKTLTIENG